MALNPMSQSINEPKDGKKYFSLDEARKSLPYVKRIVTDIQSTYQTFLQLHEALDLEQPEEESKATRAAYEQTITDLNVYVDELQLVGVELKDYEAGLLDFPAVHEGREIYLCWRADEAGIIYWHEIDAGFAGRRPVEELHDHV